MVEKKYVLATCLVTLLVVLVMCLGNGIKSFNIRIENANAYNIRINTATPQLTTATPTTVVRQETSIPDVEISSVEQEIQSNTQVGITPKEECFKTEIPLHKQLQRMRETYYKSYVDFGRKWSAMPVCPAKEPDNWYKNNRHTERYDPTETNTKTPPVVVICATIAANEEAFVREWAAHHLLLGVSRINVYPINLEQRNKLEAILYNKEPSFNRRIVWINPIEEETGETWMSEGSHHVSFEKRTIAHCYRERLNNTDIVIHIDLDEYIYPGVYPNIQSLFMAELGDNISDELAFCVRYAGYGKNPPTEVNPNNTFYLKKVTHSGAFCSNSKTGGMSRCVKKPLIKVRSHYVHYLPLKSGCRPHGNMIGVLLKKGPPTPCCRPSFFVAHMQHRDFQLDRKRRIREAKDYDAQLMTYVDWHTMTSFIDRRLLPFGVAAQQAISEGCFKEVGTICPVKVNPSVVSVDML